MSAHFRRNFYFSSWMCFEASFESCSSFCFKTRPKSLILSRKKGHRRPKWLVCESYQAFYLPFLVKYSMPLWDIQVSTKIIVFSFLTIRRFQKELLWPNLVDALYLKNSGPDFLSGWFQTLKIHLKVSGAIFQCWNLAWNWDCYASLRPYHIDNCRAWFWAEQKSWFSLLSHLWTSDLRLRPYWSVFEAVIHSYRFVTRIPVDSRLSWNRHRVLWGLFWHSIFQWSFHSAFCHLGSFWSIELASIF